MGWDVVQIGLKHDLPVNDPFAMAKEVAKRMEQNVRLVYWNEYEYDVVNNIVSNVDDYELFELGRYEINDSNDYLRIIVSNYQARQIMESAGIAKLQQATFTSVYAKSIFDDIDTVNLYEIEDNEANLDISILKENVILDICVDERWHWWERSFHRLNLNLERLRNYRMRIFNQAKLFGCNEVIICSDQGPTEMIYNNADYSADALKEYAHSFRYLDDTAWLDVKEKDEWKKHAKHIVFSSLFQNQLKLSEEDFVEVIFDDFSDIAVPNVYLKIDVLR